MRKRVMNTFRYRDCDAFAEYLHHQSLQGWHFKEWRFGLIFEKGEPSDIHYVVEVFPNGAEMDTHPEEETLEYAEYCETAGWKLLDSSRKFCIFRRQKEDAVPIVEPEERFKNIRKAEWLFWLSRSIPVFLLTGLQWSQMLSWNFKNWIFSDLMLFTLLFMAFISTQVLLEGIVLLFWSYMKRNLLKSGEIPSYGRKRHWDPRVLPLLVYFLFIGFLGYHQKQIYLPVLLPAAATIILLLLTGAWIAFWRPSRTDNWIFQFASASVILIVCFIFTAAFIFSNPDSDNALKNAETLPSGQAGYRQMEGEISFVNVDHIEGILGSADRFYISYCTEAFEDNSSDNDALSGEARPSQKDVNYEASSEYMDTDCLWYTIYQSSHPWILDELWNEEMPDFQEHPQERTEAWNALSAVGWDGTDHCYKELVRYPDRLFVLYSDKKPEDSQIEIIREKTGAVHK